MTVFFQIDRFNAPNETKQIDIERNKWKMSFTKLIALRQTLRQGTVSSSPVSSLKSSLQPLLPINFL